MPELVLVPHKEGDGLNRTNLDSHPPSEHPNWKGDHPFLPRLSFCLTIYIPTPSIPNQADNTSPQPEKFQQLPYSRKLPNHPPILRIGGDGYSDLDQSISPLLQTFNQPPHEHLNAPCNISHAPQPTTSKLVNPSPPHPWNGDPVMST